MNRYLYFDAIHLLKTIRNKLLNSSEYILLRFCLILKTSWLLNQTMNAFLDVTCKLYAMLIHSLTLICGEHHNHHMSHCIQETTKKMLIRPRPYFIKEPFQFAKFTHRRPGEAGLLSFVCIWWLTENSKGTLQILLALLLFLKSKKFSLFKIGKCVVANADGSKHSMQ